MTKDHEKVEKGKVVLIYAKCMSCGRISRHENAKKPQDQTDDEWISEYNAFSELYR